MANAYDPSDPNNTPMNKTSLAWAMTGGFAGLWIVVGTILAFWVRAKTVNEASKSNYCW